MELRVLNYFLAIAREQSIVRAARSLHLSQPTLSTQIRHLEEELGVQLLIRGTKGSRKITLTEEGMILRKRAEEILELVQKTEKEITLADDLLMGDVYIGTGETESVRLLARAARQLQERSPGIRYHISSGNASFVLEQLDKGLIDFGVVFGSVDPSRYHSLPLARTDLWGVLMPRDCPLAQKEEITPEDLKNRPLILSQQETREKSLAQWFGCDLEDLHIAATYNLLFNASLLVEEGLGYAVGLDGIIRTDGDSPLCFRPLSPGLENTLSIIWKKYQVFSKPAERFLSVLKTLL